MFLYTKDPHKSLGLFPTFKKNTKVKNKTLCNNYSHWFQCTINDYKTYIPDCFLDENDNLIVDYNPTELDTQVGEEVLLITVCYEWALVKNSINQIGWLPLSKLHGKPNVKIY